MPTSQDYQNRMNRYKKMNNQSRFHNQNKLFIIKIIKFFTIDNLSKLNIPPLLARKLLVLIKKVRMGGR